MTNIGSTNTKRIILGIIIALVVTVLVVVAACIALLKLMPDSIGAYYIRDLIESSHGRFLISGR